MRVLYVDDALAIHGGIERVITDKLNWLAENGGCQVCLLIADQGNHPVVFPLSSKVECHDLGIMFHQMYRYSVWKRCRLFFHLHRLFRQRMSAQIQAFSPDIIICTRLDFIGDVMKVRGNIPVVYESHETYIVDKFEKNSWQRKLLVKFWYHALKKIQMIVSLTQRDALNWKKINPHVEVIPNVVHLNDSGKYSDCSSKIAIFVGRYSYQKDLQSLLRIWEIVSQQHPDWQLHIYGGYGVEQDMILSEIKKNDANISVHESTSDIMDRYKESSILLLTSRYEPFGLVLPEAMSCGLPVVAFDCPYGPRDIIHDGVDGFVIENRDINQFAEKVCLLMDNPDLRLKMGKEGIKSSARYENKVIMPIWIKLFQSLKAKKD